MSEPLKLLDLFAGIGGFSLGMERTDGFKTIGFCENDPKAQMVLRAHWPSVPIHDDVRTLPFSVCLDGDVRTTYQQPPSPWETKMAGKLKKLTSDQAAESVEMYKSGLSLQEVANYFKVSRQAMWDLLRRRIELRSGKKYGDENHFFRGGKTADERAHDLVERAVKKGILSPQPCEVCGLEGQFKDGRNLVQAHHDDYNHPLKVRWLCQPHHHEWHKNNQARGLEVPLEAEQVDVICGGFP